MSCPACVVLQVCATDCALFPFLKAYNLLSSGLHKLGAVQECSFEAWLAEMGSSSLSLRVGGECASVGVVMETALPIYW